MQFLRKIAKSCHPKIWGAGGPIHNFVNAIHNFVNAIHNFVNAIHKMTLIFFSFFKILLVPKNTFFFNQVISTILTAERIHVQTLLFLFYLNIA
jgi:hypothetical protein